MLPLLEGKRQVIITFLEEENAEEVHPEWEAEINSRMPLRLHEGQDVTDEITKELAG